MTKKKIPVIHVDEPVVRCGCGLPDRHIGKHAPVLNPLSEYIRRRNTPSPWEVLKFLLIIGTITFAIGGFLAVSRMYLMTVQDDSVCKAKAYDEFAEVVRVIKDASK